MGLIRRIGFNLSHRVGAILFGLLHGDFAVIHAPFLFRDRFLLIVGMLLLGGYVFLGKRYWFSVPFRGIMLATAL